MPRFMKANVSGEELVEKLISLAKKAKHEVLTDESNQEELEQYLEWMEEYSEDEEYQMELTLGRCLLTDPKDLKKVEFDYENVIFERFDTVHGSTVIWAYAGGDWEHSVYFVVYIDDKNKIRFYIPSDGNTYCHKCKTAWGSCECGENENDEHYDDEPNWYLMEADVESRLQIK